MVCQDDHPCAGLKAGIEGAIHRVQAIWNEKLTTEELIFLLVYAKNVFNEINRFGMIWAVRHLWLSGAHFVFSYYRHLSSCVLRNRNGTASFLHGREGVEQG